MTTTTTTDTVPLFLYGAGGMLSGELLRLLEGHPTLKLASAASRRETPLATSHPHYASDAPTRATDDVDEELAQRVAAGGPAAVVFALPHGESAHAWSRLAEVLEGADDVALVDLAADFRLRDPARYASAYGREHPIAEDLGRFVYGLPEFEREAIRTARAVAAPGCFATAMQLGVMPAARAGLLDTTHPWILNAVTGSSGSGNAPKPGTHHPHRHGNLWAYALGGHRHEAELEQALEAEGLAPAIHFLPHSGPFARGIHLTAALPLAQSVTTADARAVFAEAYQGEPYVDVMTGENVPDLRSVVGSNRALVGAWVRRDVLTVVVCLDNLVKGGAGQALQCLNLMLGQPETWGLPRMGLGVS